MRNTYIDTYRGARVCVWVHTRTERGANRMGPPTRPAFLSTRSNCYITFAQFAATSNPRSPNHKPAFNYSTNNPTYIHIYVYMYIYVMFAERDGTNRKRKGNNAACASISSLNGTLFTRRQAHMWLYMCMYVCVCECAKIFLAYRKDELLLIVSSNAPDILVRTWTLFTPIKARHLTYKYIELR